MIFGNCPYCDEPMSNELADGELPQFERLISDCCNNPVWLKHSRFEPVAYTEDQFFIEFKIDDFTNNICQKSVAK